jgi:hypothetical protein
MELILWLILMAAFYIVPEILKRRRKPEEYEYPEIPDRVPPPETKAPAAKPKEKPAPVKTMSEPVYLPPVSATAGAFAAMPDMLYHLAEEPKTAAVTMSEYVPWQGRLDNASVLNGVIYAEILQPPKALRKIHRH